MKKDITKAEQKIGEDFFETSWEKSWTYIRTVVDVVREPMLILDKDLRVLAVNEPFYETFKVAPAAVIGRLLHELGSGQWNIPTLQKFLKDILPKKTFFKGYEVAHDFPGIGRKVMIMNARELHFKVGEAFEHIILLAMEDVTAMIAVAERMSDHVNKVEIKMSEQTKAMMLKIEKLQKELETLRGK